MGGMLRGGLMTYIIGFILSLLLTIGAFMLVMNNMLDGNEALIVIISLAVIQLFVQLFFFLHLGAFA